MRTARGRRYECCEELVGAVCVADRKNTVCKRNGGTATRGKKGRVLPIAPAKETNKGVSISGEPVSGCGGWRNTNGQGEATNNSMPRGDGVWHELGNDTIFFVRLISSCSGETIFKENEIGVRWGDLHMG